jgi:hypothetical protein
LFFTFFFFDLFVILHITFIPSFTSPSLPHLLSLTGISNEEIQTTDTESLLFRSESVPTKFYRSYNLRYGHDYLHSVIGTFLNFVQQKLFQNFDLSSFSELTSFHNEPHTPKMEIQLEKTKDNSSLHSSVAHETLNDGQIRRKIAIQKFEAAFDALLSILIGSIHSVPHEIKLVISTITPMVSIKFGEKSKRTFVVGYFFLRFLCPALALPNIFGMTVSDQMKEFCILASRILQTAASQKSFKTPNMNFGNKIIERCGDRLDAFINEMIGIPLTSEKRNYLESCKSVFLVRKSKFEHRCPRGADQISCVCDNSHVENSVSVKYFLDFVDNQENQIRQLIKQSIDLSGTDMTSELKSVRKLKRESESVRIAMCDIETRYKNYSIRLVLSSLSLKNSKCKPKGDGETVNQ